jgi:hypothetical protein
MGERTTRRCVAGATDQPGTGQLARDSTQTARADTLRQLDGGPHIIGRRGAAGNQSQQQGTTASTDQGLPANGQQAMSGELEALAFEPAGGG